MNQTNKTAKNISWNSSSKLLGGRKLFVQGITYSILNGITDTNTPKRINFLSFSFWFSFKLFCSNSVAWLKPRWHIEKIMHLFVICVLCSFVWPGKKCQAKTKNRARSMCILYVSGIKSAFPSSIFFDFLVYLLPLPRGNAINKKQGTTKNCCERIFPLPVVRCSKSFAQLMMVLSDLFALLSLRSWFEWLR